jgi:hypothetical protein
MKDKFLIFYGNPCSSALSDPEIQSFEDTRRHRVVACPYALNPSRCPPPRIGCVRLEGVWMARRVVHCYTEISQRTLLLERELFRLEGPLPGDVVEAYVDPERGFRGITDPEEVVQRVWEHARAVLDPKPGERVGRLGASFGAGRERRAPWCTTPCKNGLHSSDVTYLRPTANGSS